MKYNFSAFCFLMNSSYNRHKSARKFMSVKTFIRLFFSWDSNQCTDLREACNWCGFLRWPRSATFFYKSQLFYTNHNFFLQITTFFHKPQLFSIKYNFFSNIATFFCKVQLFFPILQLFSTKYNFFFLNIATFFYKPQLFSSIL